MFRIIRFHIMILDMIVEYMVCLAVKAVEFK